MSKFTLLLLAAVTPLATGCYARAGYYAEPAYIAPAPVYVAQSPVYASPYPYGYARVRVTQSPTYVTPRPVYAEARPTYTARHREWSHNSGPVRAHAEPGARSPTAPGTPRSPGKVRR